MKRNICLLCVMLFAVLLTACGQVTEIPTEDLPTVYHYPVPEGAEEDVLLRNPAGVGQASDYPTYTPPAEGTEGVGTDSPVAPPVTEPDPSGETRVSFVAVGDNILHGAVMEDAKAHAGEGAEYDFRYIYDNVRDEIAAADVAFVNQETMMGGRDLGYYGYPNFNGPQEAGDALVDCGFDIVCIATNHMADMRDAGLAGTIRYWKSQPVTLIGGFESKDDYETVRVHEKNGVKIALLAYTYGTNGMSVTASSGLVVPYINEEDIRRQVAKAKELGDLVIVNMHWGDDSSFTVNAEQKKYAKLLVECGVDVIIGEHPHVLQPMQWMTGKDGHKTLVTYSIGNFLSTMYNDYFMVGGMLSFDIVKKDDSTSIENVELIPTVTYYDVNRANLSIYFLDEFTEELASSHGTNAHGVTSLSQMRGYVTKAIPEEFLPDSFRKNS